MSSTPGPASSSTHFRPSVRDEVVTSAVAALSVPRHDPADSFVLHAPLELMARVGLLAHLGLGDEAAALDRVDDLRSRFLAAGEPVDDPAAVDHVDASSAAAALAGALATGDLDALDSHAAWLARHANVEAWCRLAGPVVFDSIAAAGHVPIGLHLLSRLDDPRFHPALLRGPLRELARHPDWRVSWFRTDDVSASPGPRLSAGEALRLVPALGRPGSDFIRPLMLQVERSGIADDVLRRAIPGDRDARPDAQIVVEVARACARTAAWSMLHDDPEQAPYGWSHALTMPQAMLRLVGRGLDLRGGVAVALTFAAGFRAAHGTVPLGPLDDDSAPNALDGVAGAGHHDVADLAARASVHHDAHVVKHTLASLHAAAGDPAWADVHLAAAAHLLELWAGRGDAG